MSRDICIAFEELSLSFETCFESLNFEFESSNYDNFTENYVSKIIKRNYYEKLRISNFNLSLNNINLNFY